MIAHLLIEIGTEELPPTLLEPLSKALAKSFGTLLKEAELSHESIESFASPRRIAVLIKDVPDQQADRKQTRKGPLVSLAMQDGTPTPALLGFAKSCHACVDDLRIESSDKGDTYVYDQMLCGKTLAALLEDTLPTLLDALPIPKRMHWGKVQQSFVRPVHWLVALHGDAIVPLHLFGLKASRHSFGHRIHHPHPFILHTAVDYVNSLEKAYVLVSQKQREQVILALVLELAAKHEAAALLPPALLAELVGLVEWPEALVIHFDKRFLSLPKQVLVTVMQKHQRYIALEVKGQLLPYCIVITNQTFRDPRRVITGNERVLHARFEDAAFFFEQDLRVPLKVRFDQLQQLVFQEKLGTMAQKSERIGVLMRSMAKSLKLVPNEIEQASLLSKTDLVTHMVTEFPELQGMMGFEYAARERNSANPAADPVAVALFEQYLPRHAEDVLPKSPLGVCLALADRLDTLVGIFGIGLEPTGTKDPFGLRRAMIAVLRLLETTDLDLQILLKAAVEAYPVGLLRSITANTVLEFAYERLYAYFAEDAVPKNIVDAILSTKPTKMIDLRKRIQAVLRFKEQPEALILAAAHKRITHILKSQVPTPSIINPQYFEYPAEMALYETLTSIEVATKPLLEQQDYMGILQKLTDMQTPLEQFFKEVMVMVEDPQKRQNRLLLLSALRTQCLLVADLSCLS